MADRVINSVLNSIFYISRKLERAAGGHGGGLTTKQNMLLKAITGDFKKPPSLSGLSVHMRSSHQNIKTLCGQLEKKGFISIERDSSDKRRILIKPLLYRRRGSKKDTLAMSFFSSMTVKELTALDKLLHKLSGT